MIVSLSPSPLTGVQRAAVLVVALGVEAASQLLPTLDDDEIERLSVEIARLQRVPAETVAGVLAAFRSASGEAPSADAVGGLGTARALLREGLDEERVGAILPRVEAATEGTGFDLVQAADPEDLAAFLAGEHPQTAAVILSRLPARPAAAALAHLPADLRSDVVRRLSTLTVPPASALGALDAALRQRFGPGGATGGAEGVKRAADILMQSGRSTGRAVLDDLKTRSPDLAERIESLLFVFEDISRLDDRGLARVLSAADQGALARALHGSPGHLMDRVFGSVSERVGAGLREEIEMAGTPDEAEVEEAQRAVVAVVLGLAEAGEIVIASPATAPA
jgi:flagellar motor switch protein FliG